MSFPFGSGLAGLRQRMLIAVSSGSLLGLGAVGAVGAVGALACGVDRDDPSDVCPGGNGTRVCYTREEMETSVRGSCLGNAPMSTAPPPTAEQIAALFNSDGCLPKNLVCDGCCNPAEEEGVPQDDGSCCYAQCEPNGCCGRPFTVGGLNRLAGVTRRSDWLATSTTASVPPLPPALARRIADEWLDDARMEHASIASFARFSLELLGLGAPATLVEHAQRAALDEVEHARACFSLASRFAGQALGPAALRVDDARPARDLAEAAARAFHEGCMGETIAAAHARAGLEHARDPEIRRTLAKITEDEARHAELAWRFVAWALTQGEPSVADSLGRALAQLASAPPVRRVEHESPATLAALHASGRSSETERAELTNAALAEVVLPCAQALLARCSTGAQRIASVSAERLLSGC